MGCPTEIKQDKVETTEEVLNNCKNYKIKDDLETNNEIIHKYVSTVNLLKICSIEFENEWKNNHVLLYKCHDDYNNFVYQLFTRGKLSKDFLEEFHDKYGRKLNIERSLKDLYKIFSD